LALFGAAFGRAYLVVRISYLADALKRRIETANERG
jgi:hypothetical protein